LLNADPCSTPFAQAIHVSTPFKAVQGLNREEAHVGAPHGVRTVDKRMLKYHDPLWDGRHPKDEEE
jgi:hypothetical protein